MPLRVPICPTWSEASAWVRVVGGHDFLAAADGSEGVAAAHYLAHSGKVGSDAVVFLGAAVGEAEARDHFVKDQRYLVVGGDFAEALQEAGPGGEDALHGLDDDGGKVVVVLFDDCGGGLGVVEGGDEDGFGDGPRDAAAAGVGLGEGVEGARGIAHE